jgi:N-acyl-D-aspartate/D-glutamate deacylase
MPYDMIVRGGTVVDGTGTPAFTADLAITDGFIVEVGRLDGQAAEVINADGLMVTPGFVDIHSHYDAQIAWDPVLSPSSWHGVTTVVMGNCGVGFAPARRDRREWVSGLMEGVEDIPAVALRAGLPWQWETFPEYLNYLGSLERAIDFAALVPYACVRAYVMDERSYEGVATAEDIGGILAAVRDGLAAGALGISLGRTPSHRTVDGGLVPGTTAGVEEMRAISSILGEFSHGVLELSPDVFDPTLYTPDGDLGWVFEIAAKTNRPTSFALVQCDTNPNGWRDLLDLTAAPRAARSPVFPQVHGRSPMVLMGLEARLNPLRDCPSYRPLADLPVAQRSTTINGDPALRTALVAEMSATRSRWAGNRQFSLDNVYPLGTVRPCYEPRREDSIEGVARRRGMDPCEVLLDVLVADEGVGLVNFPILNFSDRNHDAVLEMLRHPTTVLGLADGGAHCNSMCDASLPTHMLEHWTRDRDGEQLPVEAVVHMMTQATASLFGLSDRGVLASGMRADLNVIDYDRVAQLPPRPVRDLPGGASRFIQQAHGYEATIVKGCVTFRSGQHTGALPGRLIRAGRRGA